MARQYSTSSPRFEEPSSIPVSVPVPAQRNGQEMKKTTGRSGRHGAPALRPKVLKFLEQSDGRAVYIDDITREFDCSVSGVQNAIRTLQRSIPQIVTVIRGQAWKWDPSVGAAIEPAPEPKTPRPKRSAVPNSFFQIGKTQDGDLILEDSDSVLYRARPL